MASPTANRRPLPRATTSTLLRANILPSPASTLHRASILLSMVNILLRRDSTRHRRANIRLPKERRTASILPPSPRKEDTTSLRRRANILLNKHPTASRRLSHMGLLPNTSSPTERLRQANTERLPRRLEGNTALLPPRRMDRYRLRRRLPAMAPRKSSSMMLLPTLMLCAAP